MRQTFGCCATAATGQVAAPPSSVMNSRRCSGRDARFTARPRPDPYVQLSRIRLLPWVCDGTSCRIRSSAFDTRAWLRVQYVLCWSIFPLALALRSTDSATTALPVGFPRFVRRLHRYYDAVRLLVPVHHRLWLLAFPMRTVPLTRR